MGYASDGAYNHTSHFQRKDEMILLQYAVKRIFQMVLVFFVVSALIILMLVVTGDPIELMLPPNATNIQRQQIEQRLGLD
jgi:peptide/nickel transport system permease protein